MRHDFNTESGSVLTALFIGIGLLGFLSFTTYNLLNGPVRSVATVSMKSKAQADLMLAAKLLMRGATDTDADGLYEPPAFDPAASPKPTGGGGIPSTVGAAKIDPWHIPYGYCVWDHGSVNASSNRLSGATTGYNAKITLAVISAGPNRVFDTTCAGDPATYLTATANSDDLIESYTFDQAQTLELWKKRTDPGNENKIEYLSDSVLIGTPTVVGAEKLQVTGNGKIDGNLNVTGSGTINGGLTVLSGLVSLNSNNGLSSINNVAIGTVTPAAGTFTNLGVTGALTVASSALVTNLNADLLDGQHGSYYQSATNINAGTLDPARMPTITGDLSLARTNATTAAATVTRVQNQPVSATVPTAGQTLVYTAGTWTPGSLTLAGDVTGAHTANSVVKLQGRAMASTAPGANSVIGWDGAQWKPMIIAAGSGNATTIGAGGVNYLATDTNINTTNCLAGYVPVSGGATWSCAAGNSLGITLPIDADLAPTSKRIISISASSKSFLGYRGTSNLYLGPDAGAGLDVGGAGTNNIFIGSAAGSGNTSGGSNIYIGSSAGQTNTTFSNNTIVGFEAGKLNTAANNTFFGYKSGAANSTANGNTFIGSNTGLNTTTGVFNTFVGNAAGIANITGNVNVFMGYHAGYTNDNIHNVFVGNKAGELSTGKDNVYVGSEAGQLSTTATKNVLVGMSAGGDATLTGSFNVMVGYSSGQLTTSGEQNVFVGNESGTENTSGSLNTFIGRYAGKVNSTGYENTFVGSNSGIANTTGIRNTFVGRLSGSTNSTANDNTIIGHTAGNDTSTGEKNTFVGQAAGNSNTTGSYNVSVGEDAGKFQTDASSNTFIGQNAGLNTTGAENSFLGRNAGQSITTGAGNIIIGYDISAPTATTSEYFRLGTARTGVGTFMQANMLTGPLQVKGGTTTLSDSRYKRDVATLEGALHKVSLLRGVSYYWKPEYNKADTRRHIGFIAQEVRKIAPEVVFEMGADRDTYLTVSYEQLVPLLVEAVKEQQAIIKAEQDKNASQQHEIDQLKARLDRLERALSK